MVIQSTRGTFGSSGRFEPFSEEHDDGLATVAWLKQQPWFNGSLATNGASYLGFVQWAIARDAGPELKAMAVQATVSDFYGETYPGGSFALDTMLSWSHLMSVQEKPLGMVRQMLGGRKLRFAFAHLPLRDVDEIANGEHAAFFQT